MRKKNSRILLPILLVLLLILGLLGFAVGKYIETISVGGTVTFSAKLADSFVLRESEAVRQDNGAYILAAGEYITSGTQQYVLIPGLDVPKDPHVVITGKTEIPAYLYIEVVDNTPNGAISYELEECWQPTDKKTAQHGGTVYIYCTDDGTGNKAPAKITTDKTVYILKNNTVYVSQTLLGSATNDFITVYAYLEETAE